VLAPLRTLLLAALLATPSAAQVLAPLEFSVLETKVSWSACPGDSAEATGGAAISFPLISSCSLYGATNAVLTTANVDGRLQVDVTGAYAPSQDGWWVVGGELTVSGKLSVTVPSLGTAPTTEVVATISSPAMSSGLAACEFALEHDVDSPSRATSALLGSGYKPFSYWRAETQQRTGGFPVSQLSETAQFRLVAGDTVVLPFRLGIRLEAHQTAPHALSESASYELRYLPEPSASLMVPSSAAALALLAHLRAAR
jgi:hypothetical protein